MNRLKYRCILFALLATLAANASAGEAASTALRNFGAPSVQSHDEFLPVDEAFDLTARAKDAHSIVLTWIIAPGYYLYRHRISVASDMPNLRLGTMELPKGERKHDEYFGDVQVYYEVLDATLPVTSKAGKVSFNITYQGCAEAGLCYNPVTKHLTVELP